MGNIQTNSYQSWLDISIQVYGCVDNAIRLAMYNNSQITAEITPGTIIKIPELQTNKGVVLSLENLPSTALIQKEIEDLESKGIGYMIISNDFIIR